MDNNLKGEFILTPNDNSESKNSEPLKEDPLENPNHEVLHHSKHHIKNIHLADQAEGEEVLHLLRRHFITNVPWIFLAFIFFLIPFFSAFIFSSIPFFANLSQGTLALLVAFLYLFIFGFVFLNFSLWYYNMGVVTNLRLFDIDLAGILYRHNAVAKLESVEDVAFVQAGFISSLFNFGNVNIQTAGTQQNIEYDKVPKPAKVTHFIADLVKTKKT